MPMPPVDVLEESEMARKHSRSLAAIDIERRVMEVEARVRTIETRITAQIVSDLHDIDSRVAVLEERSGNADKRLGALADDFGEMRHEIRGLRDDVAGVNETLMAHVAQEARDRIKLLGGLVLGLIGIYAPEVLPVLKALALGPFGH